ncbi:MAG: hypothetical protein HY323_05350 [Betaproteobacteria bacterium]|nr:hypothetical protein [Betaproteobacteria bacterium]
MTAQESGSCSTPPSLLLVRLDEATSGFIERRIGNGIRHGYDFTYQLHHRDEPPPATRKGAG